SGFRSRDELLLWVLDLSKWTLGRIPDDMAIHVIGDPWATNALLDPATTDGVRPPDETQLANLLIGEVVVPSFNSTRGWLRAKANDYEEPVNADAQKHTALIPRVDHVSTVQHRVVETALDVDEAVATTPHHGPVETTADILDWIGDVSYATQGFTPDAVVSKAQRLGSPWRRSLTHTRGAGLRIRLARDLYPAMNEAILYTAEAGMEQAEEVYEKTKPTEL
ncbi:MAG: hypothetical protein ACOCY1_05635, partial [Halovenus sp.]